MRRGLFSHVKKTQTLKMLGRSPFRTCLTFSFKRFQNVRQIVTANLPTTSNLGKLLSVEIWDSDTWRRISISISIFYLSIWLWHLTWSFRGIICIKQPNGEKKPRNWRNSSKQRMREYNLNKCCNWIKMKTKNLWIYKTATI